jgi:Protein of unknown function, DUF417
MGVTKVPHMRNRCQEQRAQRAAASVNPDQATSNRMKTSFNAAETGHGSYRLLAPLRWVMVIIFVSFGIQKFTPQSAQGIAEYINHSPFVSWLSVFGLRGEANLLGVVELCIAALRGGRVQSDPVSHRFVDGSAHFCRHMVVLFHHAGCRPMELISRSDRMELDRRVSVQGHRSAMRLRGIVPRVSAAIRRAIALRLKSLHHRSARGAQDDGGARYVVPNTPSARRSR